MNNAQQQASSMMINQQLRTAGVLNDNILAIIKNTPRKLFVPAAYRDFAYADMTIPLAHGQQMLLPQDEGLMIQALAIKDTDSVLEVGTGTGYFTALLAQLASQVTTVDIFQDFLDAAQDHQFLKNFTNISYRCDDAARGFNGMETFDAIVITGALEKLPDSYLKALKPNGRLVAIIGDLPALHARLFIKKNNSITESLLFETVTPYLVNAEMQSTFNF